MMTVVPIGVRGGVLVRLRCRCWSCRAMVVVVIACRDARTGGAVVGAVAVRAAAGVGVSVLQRSRHGRRTPPSRRGSVDLLLRRGVACRDAWRGGDFSTRRCSQRAAASSSGVMI